MALGFLPVVVVRINFERLRNFRRTRRLLLWLLKKIFSHFKGTYLNGVFLSPMWNVFTKPMELWTNNVVESYHKHWNKTNGGQHPSIWQLIRVLKEDQESIDAIRFQANQDGLAPPRRNLKWTNLESDYRFKNAIYDWCVDTRDD